MKNDKSYIYIYIILSNSLIYFLFIEYSITHFHLDSLQTALFSASIYKTSNDTEYGPSSLLRDNGEIVIADYSNSIIKENIIVILRYQTKCGFKELFICR